MGALTLTGPALAACDVDAGASPVPTAITITDALVLAQYTVGLPVALDCCP